MGKLLNELAGILKVSRDGLQAVFQEIGLNYHEVYDVLAREQAISSVMDNLTVVIVLPSMLSGMSILYFMINKEYMRESTVKQYFNAWKIAVPILLIAWVLLSLTPLLTPNLNLIKGLLND
jgi:uncharacterized membrane protein YidH (DUF202 family)